MLFILHRHCICTLPSSHQLRFHHHILPQSFLVLGVSPFACASSSASRWYSTCCCSICFFIAASEEEHCVREGSGGERRRLQHSPTSAPPAPLPMPLFLICSSCVCVSISSLTSEYVLERISEQKRVKPQR